MKMIRFLQPFYRKFLRCFSKIRLKFMCAAIGSIFILDFFGAFTHIFEVSYNDNFIYPYNGDIQPFIYALRHKKKPDVEPINVYDYKFIHNATNRCVDPDFRKLHLVFLVKSAINNFDKRQGIRNSWGFGSRFFDVPTRLIFLLGTHPWDKDLISKVNVEAEKHKDILQADFIDSYYNNTRKTMMGFKWAVEHCSSSKFYMFVDDDIYVSVKNVLKFVRNPAYYPVYLKELNEIGRRKREIKDFELQTNSSELNYTNEEGKNSLFGRISKRATVREKIMLRRKPGWKSHNKTRIPISEPFIVNTGNLSTESLKNLNTESKLLVESSENQTRLENKIVRKKRQVFDLELPNDVRLFAGYVLVSSPHRHKTSKWYVSLKEYPYHLWPPYITAGAYVLSKEALIDMYYASLYTQHFKFDDIFLGIVAKKADIELFHCDEFHFYKKDYTKYNYKHVITSHGYDDPSELMAVWQEQKVLGNA